MDDDEALLARAEAALTEIKIAQGLSDEHASVLAALRIRLKGKADASFEELLESTGDLGGPAEKQAAAPPASKTPSFEDALSRPSPTSSLDDILAKPDEPKPDWPG